MAADVGQHNENEDFPATLGRYRLVRRISTGGMAQVFEARRESLAGVAPRVAIKVILPEHAQDMNFQRLFVNEARIGSQLQHPNLVQIQDFDREKDCYYLVMEYVEGPTLRRVLSLSKRSGLEIPLPVIAEVGRQMCEGLHYAHTAVDESGEPRHLVHRDIKPGNVILNPQGVVKVLDFGISKALTGKDTADGIKGTWGYMSPEQARADSVGGAADQWGVASVLYEMACLQRMFSERDHKIIRERMEKDDAARQATTLSGPYRDLGPILVRALQRDPMARYPTALQFAKALSELVPDPIVTRETLIEFQKKISTLNATRLQGGDLSRSHSTLSRAASSKPYQSGIPVSVGNVHRPMSPAEIRPEDRPKEKRKKGSNKESMGTVHLAFVGAAICVLLFTLFHVFKGDGSSSVDRIPVENALSPAPVVGGVEGDETVAKESQESETRAPRGPAEELNRLLESDDVPKARSASAEPAAQNTIESVPPVRTTPPVVRAQTPVKPRATEVEESPEVAVETGVVNISSWPKSRVFVDGQYIQDSPLSNHEVPAGSHEIRLQAPDGRQHSFTVEVETGMNLRRIWHFESSSWIE